MISKNGNFVLTACGLGKDKQFGDYAQRIIGSTSNLFVNQDNSVVPILSTTNITKQGNKIIKSETIKYIKLNYKITIDEHNGWLKYKSGWENNDIPNSIKNIQMNSNQLPALQLINNQ
jgi:hypothetical protein